MVISGSWFVALTHFDVFFLYVKLADIQHGTEFLSKTALLNSLSSIIRCTIKRLVICCNNFCTITRLHLKKKIMVSNASTESILRSRALMISGRLLSKENIYMFVDESSKISWQYWNISVCVFSLKDPNFLYVWRGVEKLLLLSCLLNIKYNAAWFL